MSWRCWHEGGGVRGEGVGDVGMRRAGRVKRDVIGNHLSGEVRGSGELGRFWWAVVAVVAIMAVTSC